MATDTLGFELIGFRALKKIILVNGKVKGENNAEYVQITDDDGQTIVALKLFDVIYTYNSETEELDENDIVDDDYTIVDVTSADIMVFEKNTYLKKRVFDAAKESDQQNNSYQPISGLLTDSSYLTIKTHSFQSSKDEPAHGDLIFYQKRFWMIEEVGKTFVYTPRERVILRIAMKAINK